MALVLDTGPIVALLDSSDPSHRPCVDLVEDLGEDLIVPAPVLVEVDYWLRKLFGHQPWDVLVSDVAEGAYRLHDLDVADLTRAAELERRYESLDLGFVDAAVVVTCERLGETKVATLDRRDFSVVRPRHCDGLRLLPD
jgi:predicted nucleic acid-binding protein